MPPLLSSRFQCARCVPIHPANTHAYTKPFCRLLSSRVCCVVLCLHSVSEQTGEYVQRSWIQDWGSLQLWLCQVKRACILCFLSLSFALPFLCRAAVLCLQLLHTHSRAHIRLHLAHACTHTRTRRGFLKQSYHNPYLLLTGVLGTIGTIPIMKTWLFPSGD